MPQPRVLVAAQPGAWMVVQRMLVDVVDLIPAHTRAGAFEALARERGSIDLVISSVAFDDSRLIDFLQAVKRQPAMSGIPFLCIRVMASVLSDDLIGRVGDVCRDCGAVDFLDIGNLGDDAGQTALRAAALKYAAPSRGC